jgi:predicted RND superfamily exporter protein
VVLTGEHERSLLAPAALNFMAGLQQEMEANPDVGKTVSLADFVRRMNQVMHEGKKEFDAIPGSQEMIAQYIQLYELSGDPDDFSSQVDFDYRMGQVLIQMRDGSAARTRVVKEMAQRYAAEHLPSGFDLRLAGSLVRYDTVNIYIVSGQLWSLASSLLMVFAVVALLFSRRMTLRTGAEAAGRAARWARGLSAGGLTLIPILTAVAMNFGAMVLLGIPLDIATALISSCAIGIGIDYSIHLLYRYELERSEGATVTAAISIAARACGPPILYNATAVSAGFLTLLYSDFLALHTLAWLTALAMFVTAFSALTLLPAWLFVRDGRAELAGRP